VRRVPWSLCFFIFSSAACVVAQSPVLPPGATISSVHAAAQPAAPLTLAQVLDLAHQANPSLLAAGDHLSAVRAQEVTAGLRQNPTALLQGQMFTLSPGDPNGTEFYLAGVQRLFERGNKRDLRLKSARSSTAVGTFQLDDQRRQTDLAVRQAFARMLYARLALGISEENLRDYRKTVELMQVRLDAGAVDRTDFDRVELQLAGFESDLDNANLILKQSSIGLQTLIGVAQPTDDFSIVGSLDPPAVTATLESLRSNALARRPDLKAAETQVVANEAAAKLAIATGTADPTVETEFERAGSSYTFGASVNVPLRIFDRNQGEKERTRYEVNSSRFALVAARNQVLSDVDSAWAAYQTSQSQTGRYRGKYLAEAAHVRDNLEFSYRNGNTTLLDYLSALSDYRQVNLASLNAELNLLLALEQLSYAAQTEIVP
jgi:cobalt-zinc-cadmium efflux system outer membrane protein